LKKISIIICNYNNQKYITKCLRSIYKQNINKKLFDVIFVDDGSTDKSVNYAKKFKKYKNFHLIKNRKNLGLIKSCNIAIKKCKTKYLVRVDSDDYISKNFLKYFFREMNLDYDFIYSNYIVEKNNKKFKKKLKKFDILKLISCSVVMKTNLVKKIGGYRNIFWEECDLYVRYLKDNRKKVKHLDKYVYIYRKHGFNMTFSRKRRLLAWREFFKKYSKFTIKKINRSVEKKMDILNK